jgi:competence protein ComEC
MVLQALFFVVGVWCLQQLPALPSIGWACLMLPFVWLTWHCGRSQSSVNQKLVQALWLLVAMMAGFFWAAAYAHVRLADELPKAQEGRDIQLIGVVASLPQLTAHGQRFVFDVEQVITPDAVVPRRISLSYSSAGQRKAQDAGHVFQPAERWQLTVKLRRPHSLTNPQGFDFEVWMLERNLRASGSIKKHTENQKLEKHVIRPGYLVECARGTIRDHMTNVLGDRPYAGILKALVIGDGGGISSSQWQVFLRTGINHLVSISGLHVTMLAGMAFAFTHWLWRKKPQWMLHLPARKAATLAGVFAALMYALVAGFSIPTQRALYMLSVFALALLLGRHVSILRVLAYALFVVVLIDPWAVLAAGFWLSFGAVAFMAYALGGRLRPAHWLPNAISAQWAITLGLIPLLLAMFQQFSMISPLANAVAIPVFSLIVVPLTLIGSVLPIEWPLLLAHEITAACMWVMEQMSALPASIWSQHAPPPWSIPLAVLAIFWMLLPSGFPLRWLGAIGLLPLFVVVPQTPQHGAMEVTVLDVGQGLAVVVRTASHSLLYDAGPPQSNEQDSGNRIIVPNLKAAGVRILDAMVISHDDVDHTGGAASVLALMPVKWMSTPLAADHHLLQNQQHVRCHAGQRWEWDGVRFEMLYPSPDSYEKAPVNDNDQSCVLRVISQYGSILIPGDIEKAAEFSLVRSGQSLQSDVLIAPHHGSKTSSTEVFLDSVNPQLTIFTTGYRNRYRHPHRVVVKRYHSRNIPTFQSDRDGAILLNFSSDAGLQLTRWRSQYKRYWQVSDDKSL